MTASDPLARLSAGLDRDEAIARTAIGDRTATRWVADDDDVWGVEGEMSGPHRCDQHPEGRPNNCDDDPIATAEDNADRLMPARAVHIARFSPYRELRTVEAIRKVLAVCDAIDAAALDGAWWEGKYGDRADDIREALAGIYTEPTDTQKGPQT